MGSSPRTSIGAACRLASVAQESTSGSRPSTYSSSPPLAAESTGPLITDASRWATARLGRLPNARARRNNYPPPGWPSWSRCSVPVKRSRRSGPTLMSQTMSSARRASLGRSVSCPVAPTSQHRRRAASQLAPSLPGLAAAPEAVDGPSSAADHRQLPSLDEIAMLSLGAAVDLAREHEAPLGWLCGREPVRARDRMPPAAAILDVTALRAARQRARVKDAVLRRDSGLDADVAPDLAGFSAAGRRRASAACRQRWRRGR